MSCSSIADEDDHLGYAERWLSARFSAVDTVVLEVCGRALPLTLAMVRSLADDLQAIGIDPLALLAAFAELFQNALETIGFEAPLARRVLARAVATAAANTAWTAPD